VCVFQHLAEAEVFFFDETSGCLRVVGTSRGDFIYKGGVKTKESAVTLVCAMCAFIYKVLMSIVTLLLF
jgi:hypothetical protein